MFPTSRIRLSIVRSRATTTVDPGFLAETPAAGLLHCAEQLPVKKFSSDGRFQQGPCRISGGSLQDKHDGT